MTSHSPVAVRELNAAQLYILRCINDRHHALPAGQIADVQGTIRTIPDALLAKSVLVCEGASEVGFIRGCDQFFSDQGSRSMLSYGVAVCDGGGNSVFQRALAFQRLGYRTSVLRDSDVLPTPELEAQFIAGGGNVFSWAPPLALEDALFLYLGAHQVDALLSLAIELKDESLVSAHLTSASANTASIASIQGEVLASGAVSLQNRTYLGRAARSREASKCWFKSVTAMEIVARDIVAPNIQSCGEPLQNMLRSLWAWICHD